LTVLIEPKYCKINSTIQILLIDLTKKDALN
jgi:hypothetical protein